MACSATLAQESVLYDFRGETGNMGSPVSALLLDSKGNFYGTALVGGVNDVGAVFELSKGVDGVWTGKILHNFSPDTSDGFEPNSALIFDSKGNLYGTTADGGRHGGGTVFELIPQASGTWTEKTLYSFGVNPSDGFEPVGGVVSDANGNLFGVTAGEKGTVFELMPGSGGTWTKKELFVFADEAADGAIPLASLVFDKNGNLYGTTSMGGAQELGTVFELSPQPGGTWKETVLHNFGESIDDGTTPVAGVVFDHAGNLYGTTCGGGNICGIGDHLDFGTVFELSPANGGAWEETILHKFSLSNRDGIAPQSGVVLDAKGNLYGVTGSGGVEGYGLAYELVKPTTGSWTEEYLYSFFFLYQEGYDPTGGLIFDSSGNLYGTTSKGGNGGGTFFEIANPNRTQTPQFTPAAGTFTAPVKVKITEGSSGAAIYYTTDRSTPTASSTKYTVPIAVGKTEVINAIAVAKGLEISNVAMARYVIETPTADPNFSLAPGTYDRIETLTITDATSGAAIYYTTNGAMPTSTSKKYGRPFKISASETVKALAIASGHTPSGVTTAKYVIHLPPAPAPTFYPKAGTYAAGQKVKILDTNAGATIYYTANGSTPTTLSTPYPATGLVLQKSVTIKAIAIAPGYSASNVASAAYTVQ